MYKKILVALENSAADESLLPHIAGLAKLHGSELLLLHVADGWVARNFNQLKLAESEEMKGDRAYLENIAVRFRAQGLRASTGLALGDPPREIIKTAESEHCDLIAMTSHGHRLLGDIFYGSTINEVRHYTSIPVLLVRAEKK
jgi:nucleotide-binding universal stress UspA family protein